MLNSNRISSCRSITQLIIHERKDIMRTRFGRILVVAAMVNITQNVG